MDVQMYVWVYKCIGVQMYGCPGVQVYVCTGVYNYIGVQVLIGAQMYKCTNVWMYRCIDVQMYGCTTGLGSSTVLVLGTCT